MGKEGEGDCSESLCVWRIVLPDYRGLLYQVHSGTSHRNPGTRSGFENETRVLYPMYTPGGEK